MNRVKSDETNPSSADWEKWVADHAPKLLLFARQQTRSEADAQDLVQEAIMECWQRQGRRAPPELPLVFATIRRRGIDLGRSHDRRKSRELAAAPHERVCWFESAVEDRERAEIIEAAMRNLSAIYREVITLKVWGGLTFKEIGETLGIPANTAASRYRYGLAELRKLEVLA